MAKKIINETLGIEVYRFLKKKNKLELREVINSLNDFYKVNSVSFDANEGILNRLRIFLGYRLVDIVLRRDNEGFLKSALQNVSNNILRKNTNDINSGLRKIQTVQNVFEDRPVERELLQYYVQENARLIKNIEESKVDKMTNSILGNIQAGQKKPVIVEELKKIVDRTDNGYKFIVRDQSAKLYSSITEVRAKTNNWQFYVWEDSNDDRVRSLASTGGRSSHRLLDGKIFRFSEPPQDVFKGSGANRHNPGFNYGCRCVARILFDPPEAFEKNSDGSYSYKKGWDRLA